MRYTFALLCAVGMLAVGCDKGPEAIVEDPYITVTPDHVEASFDGQIFDVQVESNCNWTISKTDAEGTAIDWVKCDRATGKGNLTFRVRVYKNNTTEERRATVTLAYEGAKAFIDVVQALNPDPGKPDEPVIPDPPTPGVEGYSMPICVFMKTSTLDVPSGTPKLIQEAAIANASIDGNRVVFSDGAVIERTGGDAALQWLNPAHTNPKSNAGFQVAIAGFNWAGGDSWIFKVPVKETLSGDLRLFYGSRREANAGGTTYAWSSDMGVTWNDAHTATPGVSDAMWKSVDFTVPEASAVPAKGEFWFKITYAGAYAEDTTKPTANLCISQGFAILPQHAPASALPAEGAEGVVFSEGFDGLTDTKAAYIDLPEAGFFKTLAAGKKSTNVYSSPNPVVSVTRCYGRPGFLQVGYADEAIVGDYMDPGVYTIDVGKRLQEMGLASATIHISLKAGGIMSAYNEPVDAKPVVQVSGSGSISDAGKMTDLPMDGWKSYLFNITDVDQTTKLAITSETVAAATSICGKIDYRFFIDDVLVKVGEGVPGGDEPTPPDPPAGDRKVLTFDFTGDPLPGWPTAGGYDHTEGGIQCVYSLDGTEYTFVLADCGGASKAQMHWAVTEPAPRLAFGAQYRYLGLPALEGYKLTQVSCESVLLNSASASMSPKMAITDRIAPSANDAKAITDDSPDVIPGGEFQTWQAGGGGTYTYTLTGTTAGTVYYIYALVKGAVSSIELTYSPVE